MAKRVRKAGVVLVTAAETEGKSLMDRAYRAAEALGSQVWGQDDAGPYQTLPSPGTPWADEGRPRRQDHEDVKAGTAKRLTLVRPATGELRACGGTTATNAVRHPWLKAELGTLVPPDVPRTRDAGGRKTLVTDHDWPPW